ncbi:MAG: prevent-host-death family protein [Candidatus Magnetoglobus multicellularis str. Araruama]|uniref:Antitoxin n=1 Tax=Candidatus Magnetoglobus multicellularis str. Araruama TaxID=890399 RepID=A0A1V1P5V4_9BACT|nr:MAG: prevent-host-death family protein [Candidatus Magnetoglobus multicellularis str. Araruama]
MKKWQLQEAKNKFSEVVDNAFKYGPQFITKRGIETVVVISVSEYNKIITPKTSLVDFFRKSPLYGVELDIVRDKSYEREFEL